MKYLIRTDASVDIGTGHAMRCLALAQEMYIAGHSIAFAMTPGSSMEGRIRSAEIDIVHIDSKPGSEEDAKETLQEAKKRDTDWIVVDGYQFNGNYQDKLNKESKMLFIDDYGHCDHYNADVVLNQNIYADQNIYRNRNKKTSLLLGVQYALLRQEFLSGSANRNIPEIASNILVTLGGGDPENVTGKVIEALRTLKDIKVKIVVGGDNPNLENINSSCKELSMEMIVNTHDMKKLMEWADVAISAGGSTCYEFACMGLPALSIVLADNQKPLAEGLDQAGVLQNLGWHTDVSPENIYEAIQTLIINKRKRGGLSKKGMSLIDGYGSARICRILTNEKLWIRSAKSKDCEMIFKWVNDPENRASSFSSDPIKWERHTDWFEKKLNDQNHIFFIAHDKEDTPVGQVRFDCEGKNSTISVSIANEQRGKGLGKAIIAQSCRKLFGSFSVDHIDAYIKEGNPASQAAFTKVGFKECAPIEIKEQVALHYILKRDTLKT